MTKLYMVSHQKRILQEGDIVSIDGGVIYKGFHSDAARTWAVGEISKKAENLIKVTEESFMKELNLQKRLLPL